MKTLNHPEISLTPVDMSCLSNPSELKSVAEVLSVFTANLDTFSNHLADFKALLSADEHNRAARYHKERDRERFITRRAILRLLLARYTRLKPKQIQLKLTPNGKPYANGFGASLDFSMSHSEGLAVYVFSSRYFVGIDVESVNTALECIQLAGRFFAPHEAAFIASGTHWQQVKRFYQCWTRKEAFIKLAGPQPLETIDTNMTPNCPCKQSDDCCYIDLELKSDDLATVAYRKRD